MQFGCDTRRTVRRVGPQGGATRARRLTAWQTTAEVAKEWASRQLGEALPAHARKKQLASSLARAQSISVPQLITTIRWRDLPARAAISSNSYRRWSYTAQVYATTSFGAIISQRRATPT